MRLRLIGSLLITLLLVAPGMAEPIKIAISPLAPTGSPKVLATGYLKKLLEERSSGRIDVAVINDSNSDHGQSLDALNRRQIQLAVLEVRNLQTQMPLLQIYDLPFLFRDRQQRHQVMDNEIGQQLLQRAQPHNLKPLAVWDGATRQLLADEPLTQSQAIIQQLGSGAQSGSLGKDDNRHTWRESLPADATLQADQLELDTLTLTNHSMSCSVLVVHRKFWEQMPEDLKVIAQGAIKDATLYIRELAEQADKGALERLKQQHKLKIHSLSVEQREQWRKKMLERFRITLGQEKLRFIDMITQN